MTPDFEKLADKAEWVRQETLKIHGRSADTRVASSLSPVEIFISLFYGGILRFNPSDQFDPERDRFIISKGHGSICFYPILADLGYFEFAELERVGQAGSFLGGIPDPVIPGFETVNGSLGHGLGVACGIALALKRQGSTRKVIVLLGDGELYEGSVWEGIMFAAHHQLDNLCLIIDNNKICMLDYCEQIIALEPLDKKFEDFDWKVCRVDGHDLPSIYAVLNESIHGELKQPVVVIADTIKGKGVTSLEGDSLCHVRSLSPEVIAELTGG